MSKSLRTVKKLNTAKLLKKGYLKGLDELIKMTENQAKKYAPVDTGFLKGLIMSKRKGTRGFVISRAKYSWFQEDGTMFMKAANHGKGFMKPAAQYVKTKISAIMGKAIRSAIK